MRLARTRSRWRTRAIGWTRASGWLRSLRLGNTGDRVEHDHKGGLKFQPAIGESGNVHGDLPPHTLAIAALAASYRAIAGELRSGRRRQSFKLGLATPTLTQPQGVRWTGPLTGKSAGFAPLTAWRYVRPRSIEIDSDEML